ncbi:MAG: DUF6273 domain-containing protein [Bacilli bacterium]
MADPDYSGSLFSDGTKINTGEVYYFKVEPIKWKIISIDDGKYTLLSDVALDVQMFYSCKENHIINGEIYYANNYEYSDIREWLNGYFYNYAFTSAQKDLISLTEVNNSASGFSSLSSATYASNNTLDKVYLLSENEYSSLSKDTSNKLASDYTKALGGVEFNSKSVYFFRSPCQYEDGVLASSTSGGVCTYIYVNETNVCVVPCLVIKI